mmetsp:Transcript_12453/g.31571  ORF Transcript_12453/g.31571 Transcript_12453/m.31571 type:complete len:226 (+) Transcript_12453:629-1306(+)
MRTIPRNTQLWEKEMKTIRSKVHHLLGICTVGTNEEGWRSKSSTLDCILRDILESILHRLFLCGFEETLRLVGGDSHLYTALEEILGTRDVTARTTPQVLPQGSAQIFEMVGFRLLGHRQETLSENGVDRKVGRSRQRYTKVTRTTLEVREHVRTFGWNGDGRFVTSGLHHTAEEERAEFELDQARVLTSIACDHFKAEICPRRDHIIKALYFAAHCRHGECFVS